MSGLPEGVSRGPWSLKENFGIWEVVDSDGKNIALVKSKDDAEYIIETINHEV